MEVKVLVDCMTQGKSYTVSGNKKDIVKAIKKELDGNVRRIRIEKEPAQKEPAEKYHVTNCFSDIRRRKEY